MYYHNYAAASQKQAFFYIGSHSLHPNSSRMKNDTDKVFSPFKTISKNSLILEFEQNGTKKKWKIVANEKCSEEIREMTSIKKLFWVKHATKKTEHSFKWRMFG